MSRGYDDEVLGKAYDARLARRLLAYACPRGLDSVCRAAGRRHLRARSGRPAHHAARHHDAIQPGRLDLLALSPPSIWASALPDCASRGCNPG